MRVIRTGQLLLRGLYGPSNTTVSDETARVICQKLEVLGVLIPSTSPLARPYKSVSKFIGRPIWGDYEDDEEEHVVDTSPSLERAA